MTSSPPTAACTDSRRRGNGDVQCCRAEASALEGGCALEPDPYGAGRKLVESRFRASTQERGEVVVVGDRQPRNHDGHRAVLADEVLDRIPEMSDLGARRRVDLVDGHEHSRRRTAAAIEHLGDRVPKEWRAVVTIGELDRRAPDGRGHRSGAETATRLRSLAGQARQALGDALGKRPGDCASSWTTSHPACAARSWISSSSTVLPLPLGARSQVVRCGSSTDPKAAPISPSTSSRPTRIRGEVPNPGVKGLAATLELCWICGSNNSEVQAQVIRRRRRCRGDGPWACDQCDRAL